MTIKLDTEKTYDWLDCNFTKKCFNDLRFCEKMDQLLMQCISQLVLV